MFSPRAMLQTPLTMVMLSLSPTMSLMKERSILILSNWKLLQIGQRRIAGAEIVQRHADAHRPQLPQHVDASASWPSTTDSVTSTSSRCGGSPASDSADVTRRAGCCS